MEFFLDSAHVSEIEEAEKLGLLNGVTTNPSLVAKTNTKTADLIKEICNVCTKPVSAEVLATDFAGMKKEALELASIASNVVIKLPLTSEGLKATNFCSKEGIPTNVTLCFNSVQALLAAKAGATYISPFVGRLDDICHSGMELISEIRTIFDNYDFSTKILVASIRSPAHIKEAALIGADVATIPFNVIQKLSQHPLTQAGLEAFIKDGEKIPQ